MKLRHLEQLAILAAVCCAATSHAADAPTAADTPAAINNHAVWKDGRPVALPKVSRPPVQGVMLFEPKETDWKYSHLQSITAFKGEHFAIWSSSQRDEDSLYVIVSRQKEPVEVLHVALSELDKP
jgi:hypothetical protein